MEREGGAIKKKVAVVDKYNHPPGKFEEKPRDRIGTARGLEVCEYCRGVCCSAMCHLICTLVEMGELNFRINLSTSFFIFFYFLLLQI